MALVLVRVPLLEERACLRGGPPVHAQPPTYRRAGLVLLAGYASVHDVSAEQRATLEADARCEVETFTGDAAAYPKPIPAPPDARVRDSLRPDLRRKTA
jgi:hypothetical protein